MVCVYCVGNMFILLNNVIKQENDYHLSAAMASVLVTAAKYVLAFTVPFLVLAF